MKHVTLSAFLVSVSLILGCEPSRDVTWKQAPQAIKNFPIIKPVGEVRHYTFPSECTCGASEDPGWGLHYESEANKQELSAIIDPYVKNAKVVIKNPEHQFGSYISDESNDKTTSSTRVVVEGYYYLGPRHQ